MHPGSDRRQRILRTRNSAWRKPCEVHAGQGHRTDRHPAAAHWNATRSDPGQPRRHHSRGNLKLAAEKLAFVDQAAKAVGVAVETVRASNDHPWETIVQTAKDRGCDLIVMASHGRRGLSAMLLGSETQKVLTHSTIPVLVVR
jgi:nucleotide-binding universal stress UspA family protein